MPAVVAVTRRVEFSAAHRLANPELSDRENREIYGPCANLHGHGHNYVLEVTVRGPVDPRTGMVINLKDLKELVGREIVAPLDHRHLNHDVPFLAGVIPTAENLIVAIWERLRPHLSERLHLRLRLWESERSFADYAGPDGGA